MVRLEEGNIGRERKLSSDERENRNMTRQGDVGKKEKQNRQEQREKMYKESRRGVYLSSLCHSSSGHLLHYIKGFALISMPLRSPHGVRLCVHPYTLIYLFVSLQSLECHVLMCVIVFILRF